MRDQDIYYSGENQDNSNTGKVIEDKSLGVVKNIISSLLSKGGKMKRDDFYGGELGHVTYDKDFVNGLSVQCEKVKSDLKNPAYEDIVNKDTQIQEDGLVVDIDNCYFYIKYPQDVIIKVVKVEIAQK
ncbi:hypothetical protein [Wolbachia endosymbiont of Brugia pahangi]|uniref:hypothetical protein n=1 Tax=Wolbachia endosymbiont of Brugia pahangi TaxID=96495 RepID=UPI0014357F52|nr:hypothetical protein [Wolbachia endosymbiont of Brugia pahangi]QIT35965.1 putative protein, WF-1 [Wolbachia endosymbiont of Brugia pahangi]